MGGAQSAFGPRAQQRAQNNGVGRATGRKRGRAHLRLDLHLLALLGARNLQTAWGPILTPKQRRQHLRKPVARSDSANHLHLFMASPLLSTWPTSRPACVSLESHCLLSALLLAQLGASPTPDSAERATEAFHFVALVANNHHEWKMLTSLGALQFAAVRNCCRR